ncbi:FixH family protein [Cyclobacterium marinum]|uniref:FixH family protein n=1 Tax=Cyclobacterium marinum (strain ATCC 25205 / DSM 745 / LMG 13164 / NCIMB 1802) TaxID=880070 RepID=G0J7G2_CYCMS|nr:FixH family protein [Cyclobacterium marinum]AEL28616.1 FixH family protein [Cyclobacterium marinum DSM 745]
MNWGNGILLLLLVFIGLMVTLVTICVRQDDIHLVTENYYAEEIKYQEHIDRVNNTQAIEGKVLQYDSVSKTLQFKLPIGAKGELHLFRPSDARMDKKIQVEIKDADFSILKLDDLEPGYWKVKMTWEAGGVAFFEEKKIDI